MDKKLKVPSLNAFFIEDPDEPGSMAIPTVIVNGDKVTLNNIRDDRLDFFRPLVAAIAKRVGSKAYFMEYNEPSRIEEIEPANAEDMSNVLIGIDGPNKAADIVKHLVNLVDEVLAERGMSTDENKPDDKTVH